MSQVILFDLDGTLTQSGEGITKCVQYALEKMGIVEEDLEKLECFIGPPLKNSFMKYADFTEEQAEQAIVYYRERYETIGMFENCLYPKIPDLLELLQINDKIMGVASSKPEKYVKQILEHFEIASYFQEIVGSEMNGQRVTKAEVIEEALARLGMQTERDKVIMVGDRAEDVLGAMSCGIQCVGATYGYGGEEELREAGAVYLAETVEDLAVLASPNDEETTEHVESIRQFDLKESDIVTENLEKDVQEEVVEKEVPFEPEESNVIPSITDTEERPRKRHVKAVKMHPLHHLWRWIYPLGLYFLITIAITLSAGIGFAIILLTGSEECTVEMLNQKLNQSSLALTMVANILSSLVCWFFYRLDQKKREQGILGKGKDLKWCPLIMWISIIMISISGCQLLNDLIWISGLHELFPTYSQVAEQTIYSQSVWLILLTVGVVAPIAEELIFRGLLFHRMKDWMKPWLAIILSALAFGLYHGNAVQFIYAFFMGALFALIYHRTGTLWATIVAHMVANLWSLLGYGYVSELAQRIPYGTWIVLAGAVILSIVPMYWIAFHKRKLS